MTFGDNHAYNHQFACAVLVESNLFFLSTVSETGLLSRARVFEYCCITRDVQDNYFSEKLYSVSPANN